MITTLIILSLSMIFFVQGKIRADIIALCALVLLMVFDILTPEEALSGFSNSVVIMMIGLFVVGGAIFKTGLAKMISSRMLHLAGKNELKLLILIMVVTASIGAFVSNTGTVALMLPIVISMANSAGINPSRLLMPLAFASSLGVATLISTPPNLVVHGALMEAGYKGLSFFSFTPIGIVCLLAGIVMMIPLSKWVLDKKENKSDDTTPKTRTQGELIKKYQLFKNLFRVYVPSQSSICSRTLQELNITQKYNLSILEIRRKSSTTGRFLKTVDQKLAGPDTILEANDVLYVFGAFENVEQFVEINKLQFTETNVTEYAGESSNEKLSVREIGIAEIVILSESTLVNKAVKETDFRMDYSVNILGVERRGEYMLNNVKDIRIHAGDVLLVQGNWENIMRLSKNQADWVMLGQPVEEASKVTLDYKAPVAAAIMLLMVVVMVFDFIPVPGVAAVIIAAILMVLTGCFRNVEDAYKTINWESVVLIGAMLPMSLALQKTGVSSFISEQLVNSLGGLGPMFLLAGIYLTTSLMTLFISNTATAVLLAPIAMQSAQAMDVSPYPFMFAVAVSASMCFVSPFSTPPNALVMTPGKYTFMDYVKVGVPIQIVMAIIMILFLPLLYPF
ncbi:MAG: SLC13 family permease [Massilibacteroides sp.]|nr:SLC13 family permease [Massilibacteroides sp.]MDD3062560.1 SLC13 family permease [Massilibacteroides sp.]MDD4115128.1 SLC13 family permease [Massilibacteroides sp.]MDD4659348.1 SLC13 family permease [Massilibacteroides sp.]